VVFQEAAMKHKEVLNAIAEIVGPVQYATIVKRFHGYSIRIPKKVVDCKKLIATEYRLGNHDMKAIAKKVGCTTMWVHLVLKTLKP
jgi:hypothetical protein